MPHAPVDVLQDIDIYSLPASGRLGPNVLLVLDNSANWGSNARLPGTCTIQNTTLQTLNLLTDDELSRNRTANRARRWAIEKCALYVFFASLGLAQTSSNSSTSA